MKRFIDLRGQGTGSLFAWYDTVRDEFERFYYGSQDWSSWSEFAKDFSDHYWKRFPWPGRGSKEDFEAKLQRYKDLLPSWVPNSEPSEDEFDRIDRSRKRIMTNGERFVWAAAFVNQLAKHSDVEIAVDNASSAVSRLRDCGNEIHEESEEMLKEILSDEE